MTCAFGCVHFNFGLAVPHARRCRGCNNPFDGRLRSGYPKVTPQFDMQFCLSPEVFLCSAACHWYSDRVQRFSKPKHASEIGCPCSLLVVLVRELNITCPHQQTSTPSNVRRWNAMNNSGEYRSPLHTRSYTLNQLIRTQVSSCARTVPRTAMTEKSFKSNPRKP